MRAILIASLAMVLAPAAAAQSLSINDDGTTAVLSFSSGGPGPDAPGSLTTTFASNNGFAGNMVDLTPAVDLELTSIDINVTGTGTTATIEIWYRNGTSFGNELNQLGDWIKIGTSYSGTSMGQDQHTPISLAGNGVTFQAGNTYGFYVNLTSYSTQTFRYTNGGPNTYANADLTLLTNCGKAQGFSGSTFFPRQLNATLYYDTKGGFTLSSSGSCGGPMTFTTSGGSGGSVAFIYGLPGSFTWNGSPCTGTTVDISNPTIAGITSGSISGNVPAGACGVIRVQAVDINSCTVSNFIDL